MAWIRGQPMRSMKALAALVLLTLSTGTVAAQRAPQETYYEMHCRILPRLHKLDVEVTIQLPPSPQDRATLAFELYSDMKVGRIDWRRSDGSTERLELRRTGEDLVWSKEFPGNTKWEIVPQVPFPKGRPISLTMRYSGGQRIGFNLYIGPEGSFATKSLWYPSFGTGVTGTFEYAIPKGYRVKATGALTDSVDAGSESIFSFRVNQPSELTFAAARYFVYHEDGATPVTLFLLKERPASREYVKKIHHVVEVLQREFGGFPQEDFAVVEIPSTRSSEAGLGGASVEGFILAASSYLDQQFSTAFFGHEISHQWWGMAVKRRGDRGMFMMDEALAQYGALRAVEALDGPTVAEQFRLRGYPGFSHYLESGLGALMFQAARLDCPLANLGPPCGSMANYELSDSKGFLVYYLLSQTVGEGKFREALKAIATTYRGQSLTWDDFLTAIQTSLGQDLSWFYEQWFNRTGAPRLTLEWRQEGNTLHCVVEQDGPAYRLTLPLQVEYKDGTSSQLDVSLKEARVEISVAARGLVRDVLLDPHYRVFHANPALLAEASALRYWVEGNLHRINGRPHEGSLRLREGLRRLPAVDPYGVEFLLRFHLAAIQQQENDLAAARRHLELALKAPSRIPEFLPLVYLRLGQIAKKQGDERTVNWAVRSVQSAERTLGWDLGASKEARELLGKP